MLRQEIRFTAKFDDPEFLIKLNVFRSKIERQWFLPKLKKDILLAMCDYDEAVYNRNPIHQLWTAATSLKLRNAVSLKLGMEYLDLNDEAYARQAISLVLKTTDNDSEFRYRIFLAIAQNLMNFESEDFVRDIIKTLRNNTKVSDKFGKQVSVKLNAIEQELNEQKQVVESKAIPAGNRPNLFKAPAAKNNKALATATGILVLLLAYDPRAGLLLLATLALLLSMKSGLSNTPSNAPARRFN